jgi:hypothetical protein
MEVDSLLLPLGCRRGRCSQSIAHVCRRTLAPQLLPLQLESPADDWNEVWWMTLC